MCRKSKTVLCDIIVLSGIVLAGLGIFLVYGADAMHKEECRTFQQASVVSAADASGTAVIVVDSDGRVTKWNAGAERLFGLYAHQIVGQNVNRIVPPELRQEHDGHYQAAMSRSVGSVRQVKCQAVRHLPDQKVERIDVIMFFWTTPHVGSTAIIFEDDRLEQMDLTGI